MRLSCARFASRAASWRMKTEHGRDGGEGSEKVRRAVQFGSGELPVKQSSDCETWIKWGWTQARLTTVLVEYRA